MSEGVQQDVWAGRHRRTSRQSFLVKWPCLASRARVSSIRMETGRRCGGVGDCSRHHPLTGAARPVKSRAPRDSTGVAEPSVTLGRRQSAAAAAEARRKTLSSRRRTFICRSPVVRQQTPFRVMPAGRRAMQSVAVITDVRAHSDWSRRQPAVYRLPTARYANTRPGPHTKRTRPPITQRCAPLRTQSTKDNRAASQLSHASQLIGSI